MEKNRETIMNFKLSAVAISIILNFSFVAYAGCSDFSKTEVSKAVEVVKGLNTGGYGSNMWVSLVDETGKICILINTADIGEDVSHKSWLGSRVTAAQKANTANSFSLDAYAISSANLYGSVQPGGALFGLQESNPVDANVAYLGDPGDWGTEQDPLVGRRIGGISVFGGGLALYKSGKNIGAIGVAGDTSCRDHAFAWQLRKTLNMMPAPSTKGVTTANVDNHGKMVSPLNGAKYGDEMIIYINKNTQNYWKGWAQPACPNSLAEGSPNLENGILVIR
jgi:hypothetical protein